MYGNEILSNKNDTPELMALGPYEIKCLHK